MSDDKRRIHIMLDTGIHKKLRLVCALNDQSIQEYVGRLIVGVVGWVNWDTEERMKTLDMEKPND